MKHKDRVFSTKQKLGNALKTRLEHEPLSKITVSELAEDCGYNRKTFYYHFTDIYDLLKWTFENETIEVLKSAEKSLSYAEAVKFIVDYSCENKAALKSAFESIGYEQLKRIIVNDFYKYIEGFIQNISEKEKINVSGQYRRFLSVYYTEAVTGTVISWIKGEMQSFTKEEITACLTNVLHSTINSAIGGKTEEIYRGERYE